MHSIAQNQILQTFQPATFWILNLENTELQTRRPSSVALEPDHRELGLDSDARRPVEGASHCCHLSEVSGPPSTFGWPQPNCPACLNPVLSWG